MYKLKNVKRNSYIMDFYNNKLTCASTNDLQLILWTFESPINNYSLLNKIIYICVRVSSIFIPILVLLVVGGDGCPRVRS
jgi:hypothetical protein